jgi:hypothetical protein
VVPTQVKVDLGVWAEAVRSAGKGLPIPERPRKPSIQAFKFYSDAAGAQFTKVKGRFIPVPNQEKRGAASIGYLPDGTVWCCSRVTWPQHLLMSARDANDHAYGCKSPTLEAVGTLLPFLTVLEYLVGKETILFTDNEAVMYGWESRRVKNDESASILLKCIHVIAHFLSCTVYIEHLPRMSSEEAALADHLTRESTTSPAELDIIDGLEHHPIPASLMDWLEDPSEDWSLVDRLLDSVRQIVNKDT